jgi:hypothetical protein
MKQYKLEPRNNQKSFYGKAIVTESDYISLKSYETIVCYIHLGEFRRTWNGYSATTMKHINTFIDAYGYSGGGKAWWENLPVEVFPF